MDMDARSFILRFLIPALLLAGGCGTRSIVVPVTRPAVIDLQSFERIVLPSVRIPSTADSLTIQFGQTFDDLLIRVLGTQEGTAFLKLPPESSFPLETDRGRVSLTAAAEMARLGQARCVLSCEVLNASYTEQRLEAEIKSSRTPGSLRRVRQGRASATCRLLVIDVQREVVAFADTLRVTSEHETHAINEEPAPLRRSDFIEDMAHRLAENIAEAARPIEDIEVVTFLVDDAYPEIDTAIVLAESGRWDAAASLLFGLTMQAKVVENADIVWYDLGLVLQYQKDFKGALDAFEQAIAINDRSRYRRAVELLLHAEGQYLEALQRR
ncbi:MAG: hypothetical protein C0600_10650 [Ignavibacteria bacterium]|nr:MAG: hypothetical protein C0600_10650 [Ignavibacteria bacterium]